MQGQEQRPGIHGTGAGGGGRSCRSSQLVMVALPGGLGCSLTVGVALHGVPMSTVCVHNMVPIGTGVYKVQGVAPSLQTTNSTCNVIGGIVVTIPT
jgi:hypothetical protein